MYAVCLKITQKVKLYSLSLKTVYTSGSVIPLFLLANKHAHINTAVLTSNSLITSFSTEQFIAQQDRLPRSFERQNFPECLRLTVKLT